MSRSPLFFLCLSFIVGCAATPSEEPKAAGPEAEDELTMERTILEDGTEYRVNENRRIVFQSDRPGAPGSEAVGAVSSALNASGTMSPWDGRASVQVVECASASGGGRLSAGCSVGSDYVLVGGGAEDTWPYTAGSPGGLLVETRPQDVDDYGQGRTWLASSKDHYYPAARSLHVWAIGLRVKKTDGTWLPRSELKSRISYNAATGSPSLSPSVTCTSRYSNLGVDIIGGGAKANGGHQLLTSSRFKQVATYIGGWTAGAKAHIYPEYASVSAYCISIDRYIPGVGGVTAFPLMTSHTASFGSDYVEASVPLSDLPTCYGGSATYNGAGRMLYRLSPADGTITRGAAASKDHGFYDGGTTTVDLMVFRVR